MGGRGSGGNRNNSYKGIPILGSNGENNNRVHSVLSGAFQVLGDFDIAGAITSVRIAEEEAMASIHEDGTLVLSPQELRDGIDNSKGYFVSDTFEGTGMHEAGHIVARNLTEKVFNDNGYSGKTLRIAGAQMTGSLEKAVLKEAKKRYGSSPVISGYSKENAKENVAEAISDVYSNRDKAHPYSKTIVQILKDVKNGKLRFNPTNW